MADPHIIRLRGRWTCRKVQAAHCDNIASSSIIDLPISVADAEAAEVRGPLSLERNFAWPHKITATQKICLVVRQFASLRQITLNGVLIDRSCYGASQALIDITDSLRRANKVALEVTILNEPTPIQTGDDLGVAALGQVWLEISEDSL